MHPFVSAAMELPNLATGLPNKLEAAGYLSVRAWADTSRIIDLGLRGPMLAAGGHGSIELRIKNAKHQANLTRT